MENKLISIIIPTYNRAHLIGETLNSLLAQTYKDWECIIVDDGSTDDTNNVVEEYVAQDNRFIFVYRPRDRRKGANACRNYGFEMSNGEYINWFDSDDIMLPNFLLEKVDAIQHYDSDYIISKTFDFNHPNSGEIVGYNSKYYLFEKYRINHLNYVKQNINWLTPDFFCRRDIAVKIHVDGYQERLGPLRGSRY